MPTPAGNSNWRCEDKDVVRAGTPQHCVELSADAGLDEWRAAARPLLAAGLSPDQILWSDGEGGLFPADAPPPAGRAAPAVPRSFFNLAGEAVLHRDRQRFALLYRLAWRAAREPGLLSVATDPLVAAVEAMAKAVRRDIHKMHAFVRFRGIRDEGGERFVAWFEPDHHIVAAAAPFFRDRFAALSWSILTPDRSVAWDGEALMFGPGIAKPADLHDGAAEELWRRYYASIFNPARLKPKAMRAEMPQRYWRNLPEAPLIEPLIAEARSRTRKMLEAPIAMPNPRPQRPAAEAQPTPPEGGLAGLRTAVAQCRRCPLWEPATQAVFGEGPADARLVLVGEQPGDQEDLTGRPFVGPAGQVLDAALEQAGIDRARVYMTNAVKHFKFAPRGKRRLHQRPDSGEIAACRWWLDQELALLKPRLVVAMGATAVQALLGRAMPIGRNRGRPIARDNAPPVLITAHPSFILRVPDADTRERERALLVEDLRLAARAAAEEADQ